jgi:hypothetical protein
MPTFVLQSVVPLLFLLALPWLDRRKIWLAWPLTHLPDLDYLVGYHRATGHNLWVVLPFVALAAWGWRKARPELVQWGAIGAVYVGSHLLMDVFAGGVTLLYPLSLHTTCYYAEIQVVTATNTPFLDAGRCSFEGVPTVATVYTWLPYTEAALLAFLVPAAFGALGWRLWRRRRTRSPSADARR